MKPRTVNALNKTFARLFALLLVACALCSQSLAQTAADTQIQNQASASYSDGDGGSYDTVSNIVTVTVAKVSGLKILPDAANDPNVVAGQTGVLFSFQVTNTGNFSDQVRFLANGGSVHLSPGSPAAVTRAVIDLNNNSAIDAGDTDIKTNGADVISNSIAQNGTINVLVEISVNSNASSGQGIQVYLGDATSDDQAPADPAAQVTPPEPAPGGGE